MGLWIPGGLSSSGGGSYTPPDWAAGSDEEIVEALEKHYAGEIDLTEYWSVGDERIVHLSAMEAMSPLTDTHVEQDVTFVISNVGGKYLSDGVTECAFQVDQKNCLLTRGCMNSAATNANGWFSQRRVWCNSTYKNAIPSTLIPIFKEFINQTSKGQYSSNILNTNDYFALRAEIEIFGSITYSFAGEGSQIKLYETSSNIAKTVSGGAWFERSPHKSSDTNFCVVVNSTTGSSYGSAKNTYGIAPFGVI